MEQRAFPVIYSRDVEGAARFYSGQLGVEVGSAPRFELFVYVDDVDEQVERLRGAGVHVMKAPGDMPWGERVAYVADPDGNPVALAAPAP